MAIRFDNRVAVITGAGGGLGKSYALFLASRGARVVVNDLGGAPDGIGRSESPAQSVVNEIKAAGGNAVANYDDISTPSGASRLIQQTLDQCGTVDVLICNAGILRDKTFLKMPLEDFEAVLRVHLLGTVYCCKAAFPIMRDKGYGRIVLTTSVSGLYGNFGQTNYGAAKAGIIGFMNALKLEGDKYNIRVNTIAPLAASRLAGTVFSDEFMRALKPEFVTPAVAYLCSEDCQATGHIVCAAGGTYARARMMQNKGIQFDPRRQVTPEMIAERYADITNMEGAIGFDRSADSTAQVRALLSQQP